MNEELTHEDSLILLFINELRQYNNTNCRWLMRRYNNEEAQKNPNLVYKAASSLLTRFFIFCDKHPELTQGEKNSIYYMLKLDLLNIEFSKYPNMDLNSVLKHLREWANKAEMLIKASEIKM